METAMVLPSLLLLLAVALGMIAAAGEFSDDLGPAFSGGFGPRRLRGSFSGCRRRHPAFPVAVDRRNAGNARTTGGPRCRTRPSPPWRF